MAYTFTVDGEFFTGRTVPGAARIRIYHQVSNRFIAGFDPDSQSLQGNQPNGFWVDVLPSTDPGWLKKIETNALSACHARFLWFIESKKTNKGCSGVLTLFAVGLPIKPEAIRFAVYMSLLYCVASLCYALT